jgi:hypothetical protein
MSMSFLSFVNAVVCLSPAVILRTPTDIFPNKRTRIARTANVYGRLRANRTIHIDVSLLGYGAQRKIRRSRACLQFLPTVSETSTTILNRPRFDLVSCSMHYETDRSQCFLSCALDLEALQTRYA